MRTTDSPEKAMLCGTARSILWMATELIKSGSLWQSSDKPSMQSQLWVVANTWVFAAAAFVITSFHMPGIAE
ncbi:MAG TPA: hypothetical protein VMV69_20060 [Pirellulales bacterium]|nr:hypothetical protein [Pirellulales bacterium]